MIGDHWRYPPSDPSHSSIPYQPPWDRLPYIEGYVPEPDPKNKKPDLMPFIYIGYVCLISYLLIRS